MKFITGRDLRTKPAQVWKSFLQEQTSSLMNNGKPIALIAPVKESDIEEI